MARIRTIKPSFTRDEELSGLPAETHLFAAGLLCVSDDSGYFNANHKLLQADISPLRECSVSTHDMLSELQGIGYIELFQGSDEKQYGRVVKFLEHQRVNRPIASKIAPLCVLGDDAVRTHTQLTEDSPQEGKGIRKGIRKGVITGNDEKSLLDFPKPQNAETFDNDFDGQDWCLKTLRAYPGSDESITVPPPFLADLYQPLLEREAPGRGGMLAAAEWFLGVVQRYAADHADGDFVMGLEKFLRGGYMQAAKGAGSKPVNGEGAGEWLVDPDSGEKMWMPARSA